MLFRECRKECKVILFIFGNIKGKWNVEKEVKENFIMFCIYIFYNFGLLNNFVLRY